MIKKGISHPCFYGNVINKFKKLKFDTPKVVKVLLVKAMTDVAIVHYLRHIYFTKYIDNLWVFFILYIYISIHIILLFYVQ